MAKKRCSYVGKIQNAGTQKVEAPCQIKGKKGSFSVKQGNDLRTK